MPITSALRRLPRSARIAVGVVAFVVGVLVLTRPTTSLGLLALLLGGAMLLAAPGRFTPTIYLYDNSPGGVGLSSPLYERRDELLAQAREVVAGCDCHGGCPACVGPILEADEGAAGTPRELALRVLDLLAAA